MNKQSNTSGKSGTELFIRTGNLRIPPFVLEKLIDVKIEQKINEHSSLYFVGLLADGVGDSYVNLPMEGANIALVSVEDSGEQHTLFQGVVKDAVIRVVQDTYHIEVHALAYSYWLDIEKKSRSFQDKEKSYTDLLKQVMAAYPGGAVIDVATDGIPTNKFIIQHMETDWEFLKRLASQFKTGIVCEPGFDGPKIYFGVPELQSLTLDTFEYSVKKDIDRFKQLSENGVEGLSEHDFIYYVVETPHVTKIGDKIEFLDKSFHVSEMKSVADKGLLINHLTIVANKGLCQPYISHEEIVGASFNGQILEVENDRVKVRLDIDWGHDPGPPCFFPYSTVYSSEDGSGWYCMPEINDTVRLYCPDGEDEHCYVISSVHESVDAAQIPQRGNSGGGSSGGGSSGGGASPGGATRSDPSVKSLRNSCGMEIQLTPDGIFICAGDSTITLTEEGIVIASAQDITFQAEQNIVMVAESEIQIVGSTSVELSGGGAEVMIEGDVEIKGEEVRSN